MGVVNFAGTSEVKEAHRFDERKLLDWMAAHVPDFRGPLTVEQFKGGQSNPTYKLNTPQRNYVMRRKPPGALLKGAHAVEREARVLIALERASYPVPHVYGLCTDETVIGTWFYVMDMVEGRIAWDSTFPDVVRAERRAYFDAMNEAIAKLHSIDYAAIGLEDYGRTGGYFERQIARWAKQYSGDTDAGRLPEMDRLIEWLPANIPPGDETSIVHGDFRADNMIFHPTKPEILAVLDWELSTLGHPLADFAYHLMMYRLPPSIISGLAGKDLGVLNIPSEEESVAAYCRRTHRKSIPHLEFYLTFNMFRFAAIIHGIKGRLLRGTAASSEARSMVEALPILLARASAQMKNAG